ncbi:MAG: TonB C-terminal domain-containing protein [Proteobacteria bacterium]|nr:TonB C-terminal domain-containing protein [Pseudomonadota bacterium]
MRKGAFLSGLLHVVVALIAVFGLPQFLRSAPVAEQPLVVELLPIAEKTNPPPPKQELAQPKPEPPKKELAQAAKPPEPPKPPPPPPPPPPPAPPPVPPPPAPKVEAPAPKPEPAKAEIAAPRVEAPLPKPLAPRPEPPKAQAEQKTQPKQQAFDLDSVLKNLTKQRPQPQPADRTPTLAPQAATPPAPRVASAAPTNPQLPPSMSEIDAIRQHIQQYWNPPVGAREAQNLVIDLRVAVDLDGSVRDVQIIDQARVNRDEFFRAAAESAERAVRRASPLPVPRDKYDQFRVFTLGFSPREMLGSKS